MKELRDSWFEGLPGHADLSEPVAVARRVLDGWTEAEARDLWRSVQEATENWIQEHTGSPLPKPPDKQTGFYRGEAFSGDPTVRDYPSLILWEMLPGGDPTLCRLKEQPGIAPILAVIILAEAAQIDFDDVVAPMDFEETMRIFISCWRGLFQLMHLQDVIEQLSEVKIQAAIAATISARAKRAARASHEKRNRVRRRVLDRYWEGKPWRSMAEAARKIWKEVGSWAVDEVKFPVTGDPPWQTPYKWIREAEKAKREAEEG